MRLLAGVLAGTGFTTTLTGDPSLRTRPMERVAEPLRRMGARVHTEDGHAPLVVEGAALRGIAYRVPLPSAQVKSAVLLAGLAAEGETSVREPAPTRDHTERILEVLGAPVRRSDGAIVVSAYQHGGLRGRVPGDVSSAAFLLAAAALTGGRLSLPRVGLNPTRTRFLEVMRRMGVRVHERIDGDELGEPIGELLVEPGDRPIGTVVTPDELPLVIDEVPVLAALAVHAVGPTRFAGAGELRVKESDRLAGLARMLRGLGVRAGVEGDDLVIAGGGAEGGHLVLGDDHRMAMAATVAALGARGPSELVGLGSAAVSFPGFVGVLRWLGARIEGEG
jgi:3-phosphoshikimate 1-carboxyvinyltransferase